MTQYVIKTYTSSGSMYRGVFIYDDLMDAEEVYDQEKLFGRFVKVELWSGSLEKNQWKDKELLQTKP